MRRAAARTLCLAAALAVAALPFVGPRPVGAAPRRGGPPPVRTFRKDCAGKPAAPVGTLALEVLDRPTHDSAVVRADWIQGPLAEKGTVTLEVVLPDGAFLEAGGERLVLEKGLARGTDAWRVRFPTDRTSDLAVRLRVDTEDGPEMREFSLRLWEASP
jgi:hypothetical protein